MIAYSVEWFSASPWELVETSVGNLTTCMLMVNMFGGRDLALSSCFIDNIGEVFQFDTPDGDPNELVFSIEKREIGNLCHGIVTLYEFCSVLPDEEIWIII